MAVTEITQSIGSWDLALTEDVPPEVWDKIRYWGHIVVTSGRLQAVDLTDALLAQGAAAYAAPVRERDAGDTFKLAGPGMAAWLGDEDGKGAVYETAVDLTDATVPDAARALLPASGSIVEGTFYAVPGRTYSGHHLYEDPRTALTYMTQTVSTDLHPVSWRVNNDGTLDVGLDEDLFVTDPKCIIVRKGAGEDLFLRARAGQMETASDLEDFTTRVVLLAEGEGDSIATGTADIDPSLDPYLDMHGNPVAMTRLVSESGTETGNAAARAQLQLNRFSGTRNALTLTATDYDVQGDYRAGDYVWVYDPDSGLVDTSNEVLFRGLRINPIKLKVTEVTWPITAGRSVAYRAWDGTWIDLTDYVAWESGTTRVTVGDFNRALTSAGTEPVGSRPNQDTSIPGVPTFVEPFRGAAYLDGRGFTRARVVLNWNAPLNVDGSTILDGARYEIRYAVDTDSIYPATWSAVSVIRWVDMQTWAQPFAAPDSDWQTMTVAWDQTSAQLQDLSPGVGYDVQIRAVDTSENLGAWSGTTTFVATEDNIPPSTPAPATVAASRIAVQITHTLGKASGGDFNLESDLDHLEIHAQYEPAFFPDDSTLIGKLKANAGMIQARIPAVATYNVESTDAIYVKVVAVDIAGNRSGVSDSATTTALLIDDAHISDLTVSKVTAGTITASWVMAGEIKTADTGPRVRLSIDGMEVYDAAGTRTFFADADTGNVEIVGQLASSSSGRRIVVNPDNVSPEIRFYADSGTDYSYINAYSVGDLTAIGLNGAAYVNGGNTLGNRVIVGADNSGTIIETITSSTQLPHGGRIRVTPLAVNARYDDGGTAWGEMETSGSAATMLYTSGGVVTSQVYMTDTYFFSGFKPQQTGEQFVYADANGIGMYGKLRAQDATDSVLSVYSVTASGAATNMGVAYPVAYPATPYTLGSISQSTSTAWQLVSISSSAVNSIRSATSSSCIVCFNVTRGP